MANLTRWCALAAFTLSIALPQIAAAQLEEIVVTANKREENEQKVPISVTAITEKALTDSHIDDVADLQDLTPGLNMSERSVAWVPTIRGIGTLDVSAGQETAVATYVDGVYISNVFGAEVPFNNLERIEVLKGPQGTLFGRNATGGAIQFITRDPTQETVARVSVGVGNYQTRTSDLYVSGGITSTLAADLALNYVDQGQGFGHDIDTGQEIEPLSKKSARSKWLWTPTDKTTATFIADFSQRNGTQGDEKNYLPGSVGINGIAAAPYFWDVRGAFPAFRQVDQWGFSAKIRQEFEGFDFQTITAYRELWNRGQYDNAATSFPFEGVNITMQTKTFTEEVQFLSHDSGPFKWIAGAFFMDDINGWVGSGIKIIGAAVSNPATGLPAAVGYVDSVKTISSSAFSEGTLTVVDGTRLTLGLRYTRDEKELVYTTTDLYAPNGSIYDAIGGPFADATWSKPTWRAVLDHDLDPNNMVYASYNRGYRAGAYNTVGTSGIPVAPEIVDAFEAGNKSKLLDGRLVINDAVFYDKYKNLQVTVALGAEQEVLNAAQATIKGVETDLQAVITDDFSVRFGGSWLDTRYNQFLNAPCSFRNDAGQTVEYVCNPTGDKLIRAPEWQGNVGGEYTVPTQYGKFALNLNYFWTGKFAWEVDGRLVEPAYGLLNGVLSWTSVDKHYIVRAYGKNLTNREYSTFTTSQPGLGDTYAPGAPRTYGVQFEYDF